jgi:hypothetical protein
MDYAVFLSSLALVGEVRDTESITKPKKIQFD